MFSDIGYLSYLTCMFIIIIIIIAQYEPKLAEY